MEAGSPLLAPSSATFFLPLTLSVLSSSTPVRHTYPSCITFFLKCNPPLLLFTHLFSTTPHSSSSLHFFLSYPLCPSFSLFPFLFSFSIPYFHYPPSLSLSLPPPRTIGNSQGLIIPTLIRTFSLDGRGLLLLLLNMRCC